VKEVLNNVEVPLGEELLIKQTNKSGIVGPAVSHASVTPCHPSTTR
jgi:hypothetical protein